MSDVKWTSFLNVDLDLKGPRGLLRLSRAMTPALICLRASEKEATLEPASQHRSVSEAIDAIAAEVERLPAGLRSVWDRCQMKTMNVGVASGRDPHAMLFSVSRSTLSRLTAIGADLAFTVYGSRRSPDDRNVARKTNAPAARIPRSAQTRAKTQNR